MPRYFFHDHGNREFTDEDGVELAGPEDARVQAIAAAGEMLRDADRTFLKVFEWRFWVTDEVGGIVCSYRFSAAANDAR